LVTALTKAKVPVPEDLKNLADQFFEKKNKGQEVKTRGRGWGGKGFKFDAEEEAQRQEELNRQKKAWGIEVEVVEDEEEKATDESDTSSMNELGLGSAPVLNPLLSNLKLNVPLNPVVAAALTSSINPSVSLSEQLALKLFPLAPYNIAQQAAQQVLTASQLKHTPSQQQAAQNAALYAAAINLQDKLMRGLSQNKAHFEAEIEINDYPQQARWKVTHKDALTSITEFTGAAITTRGNYIPSGRNPGPNQRKLYLYIEGSTEHSVKMARTEIKHLLEEAASQAPPERAPYGRYSV